MTMPAMPTTSPTQDGYQQQTDLEGLLAFERNKKLAAWASQEYRNIKNARSSIERQWYINLAFYFGKQNIAVVSTTASSNGFKLVVPKAPPWRVRLVINKIRGIIRNELSKIVSQRPRFTVVPNSTEDDDQTAARVAEQIFDSVYSGYKLKTIFRRAEWWTCITGTGFIKDYWDPNKKDALGQQGDFCYDPISPFYIFVPDFDCIDIEQQPYVIHASTKSLQWCRTTYPGVRVTTNVAAASDLLDDAFMGMIGAKSPDKNAVLCLEVWIKPGGHPDFPQGGMFTVLGDQVVQISMKYPYNHGEYPFSKLDHIESGKFYGSSIIEDILPVQKEYNRTRSQIIENKNRMAKIQLMAPRGSIEVQKVSSEPGQVILYTPGYAPPQPIPLQNLPAYVLEEVQQLQQDMDDISGQHEISRGQNPSQVTAATALSYLQEQDDTKLAGTIESLESAVEKIGRHTLSYVAQYWSEGRIIRNVGTDMSFDAHVFKGEELKSNTDLRVESMSALPTSKAAKQAFIMDLIKLGAVEAQDALQVLELGGIEKVYESYLIDQRQAQRENLKMNEGTSVAPNDYDNHELHVLTHNKYRKTQQFEYLQDEQKILFQQHVELHKAAIAAKQPMMPEAGLGNPGETPPTDPTMGAAGQPPMPPDPGQPPLPEGM
jgi:hypothetical protein